jgi:hypothetical protein
MYTSNGGKECSAALNDVLAADQQPRGSGKVLPRIKEDREWDLEDFGSFLIRCLL